MIISTEAKQEFEKVKHPFMIKALNKLSIKKKRTST